MAELDTRNDLQAVRSDLQSAVQLLEAKIESVETRLETKIDTQTLRLTVRLGGLLAAGIAILAGILNLASSRTTSSGPSASARAIAMR